MKLEELGRRAVACKHWRWLPGMSVLRDAPGTPSHGQRQARVDDDVVTYEQALGVHIMPDLSDPATLGCLLALVREAYGNPRIALEWDHNMQVWSCGNSAPDWSWTNHGAGDTEADALVAALEAAP